jgi:hypothetical protein
MSRPRFSEGVLVALLAALFSSVSFTILPALFGPLWTLRVLIALLGLAYLLYLLRRSDERTGRLVTLATWSVGAGLSWALLPALPDYLAVHIGLLWLARALYHHNGPLAALADLALNLLAVMAGLWAFSHADSLFLGVWSFFLVQALFVAIPSATGRPAPNRPQHAPDNDHFRRARRSAEVALHRLSNQKT